MVDYLPKRIASYRNRYTLHVVSYVFLENLQNEATYPQFIPGKENK